MSYRLLCISEQYANPIPAIAIILLMSAISIIKNVMPTMAVSFHQQRQHRLRLAIAIFSSTAQGTNGAVTS